MLAICSKVGAKNLTFMTSADLDLRLINLNINKLLGSYIVPISTQNSYKIVHLFFFFFFFSSLISEIYDVCHICKQMLTVASAAQSIHNSGSLIFAGVLVY